MVRGKIFGKSKGRQRGGACKNGGSDDSSDEDYVLEEEEDEEEEEEEEGFDISENDNSCNYRDLSGDETFDSAATSSSLEYEIKTVRSKPRKRFPGQKRTRGSSVKKNIRKARVSKKVEEEEDDEEFLPDSDDDDDDDDDDSFEDEEEEEEDEESLVVKRTWKMVSRKKGILRCRKTTKQSKISKKSSRKKRRKLVSRKRGEDSDEDFVDEDRIVREMKKLKPRRNRKKRSSVVVSDSDFVDSGSSDSDFEISEEGGELERETENCRSLTTFLRSSPLSKRCQAEEGSYQRLRRKENLRNDEKDDCIGMKGKEKVESLMMVDLGKQVCGICLSEEQNTTIRGLLNCCNHYFCFACIMEWSKVESRCPLCKQRFVTISKSARIEMGLRKTVIRVPQCDQVYRPSDEELRGYLDPYASIVCMECQQGGDDNLMLLCDICDSAAHTYCVGLAREVPEGNWYCEGCRSADPGSSNLQPQDSEPHQEPATSVDSAAGIDAVDFDTSHRRPQLSIHLPEQSPFVGNSTHISPRNLHEVSEAASPMSGAGASTVSGRRRLRRQIHIMLSNSRLCPIAEMDNQTDGLSHFGVESEVVKPAAEIAAESAKTAEVGAQVFKDIGSMGDGPGTSTTDWLAGESMVSGFPRWNQRNGQFFGSTAHIAPCGYTEGISFRRVEGAKELVRSMVLTHLKRVSRDTDIGRHKFKKIARNSTHTILAACGIKHSTRAATPHQLPPNCTHAKKEEEKLNLMKGCCSSCFGSFLADVVTRCMNKRMEEDE